MAATGGASETTATIEGLFETLLEQLRRDHSRRCTLEYEVEEAERVVDRANLAVFARTRQSGSVNPAEATGCCPRKEVGSRSRREGGLYDDLLGGQKALLERDEVVARRDRLRNELKAATTEVEDSLRVFWVVLEERASIREARRKETAREERYEPKSSGEPVIEGVREASNLTSLEAAEDVHELLDRTHPSQLPADHVSSRRTQPKLPLREYKSECPRGRPPPKIQTWI